MLIHVHRQIFVTLVLIQLWLHYCLTYCKLQYDDSYQPKGFYMHAVFTSNNALIASLYILIFLEKNISFNLFLYVSALTLCDS